VDIEVADRRGSFIGSLFIGKINMAVALLQRGWAAVYAPSAERSPYKEALFRAEKEAKEGLLGQWHDWLIRKAAEAKKAKVTPISKEAQFVKVLVTEVTDGATFYAQILGDENIEKVTKAMGSVCVEGAEEEVEVEEEEGETKEAEEEAKEEPAAESEEKAAKPAKEPKLFVPERGLVCCAPFEGAWYRVQIKKIVGKDAEVVFMDYGNRDMVTVEELKACPSSCAKIPALARQCKLAGLKAPGPLSGYDSAAHELAASLIMNQELLGKVHFRDPDNFLIMTVKEEDSGESVQQKIMREGLARLDGKCPTEIKDLLEEEEQAAIKNYKNIWEYGEVSDPDEEEDPRKAGRDGRPPSLQTKAAKKEAEELKKKKQAERVAK